MNNLFKHDLIARTSQPCVGVVCPTIDVHNPRKQGESLNWAYLSQNFVLIIHWSFSLRTHVDHHSAGFGCHKMQRKIWPQLGGWHTLTSRRITALRFSEWYENLRWLCYSGQNVRRRERKKVPTGIKNILVSWLITCGCVFILDQSTIRWQRARALGNYSGILPCLTIKKYYFMCKVTLRASKTM